MSVCRPCVGPVHSCVLLEGECVHAGGSEAAGDADIMQHSYLHWQACKSRVWASSHLQLDCDPEPECDRQSAKATVATTPRDAMPCVVTSCPTMALAQMPTKSTHEPRQAAQDWSG